MVHAHQICFLLLMKTDRKILILRPRACFTRQSSMRSSEIPPLPTLGIKMHSWEKRTSLAGGCKKLPRPRRVFTRCVNHARIPVYNFWVCDHFWGGMRAPIFVFLSRGLLWPPRGSLCIIFEEVRRMSSG